MILSSRGAAAFKRSEFAIINTDNPGQHVYTRVFSLCCQFTSLWADDLPVERILTLEDRDGLQMDLRIEYEYDAQVTMDLSARSDPS